MKTILTTAAACLMAAMTFAGTNAGTNKSETIVLNVGKLKPGGKTPVFKAGDFQTAEKMNLADITSVEIGNTFVDNGDFDLSKANPGMVALQIPWAWSAGGKSQALRVTSLMVDSRTKVILGAVSDSMYFSLPEGIHAITNDILKAVCAKKFSKSGCRKSTGRRARAMSSISGLSTAASSGSS